VTGKYNGRAIVILPEFFIQACHFNENHLIGRVCSINSSGKVENWTVKEEIPGIIESKISTTHFKTSSIFSCLESQIEKLVSPEAKETYIEFMKTEFHVLNSMFERSKSLGKHHSDSEFQTLRTLNQNNNK
jgi:hypothetical protein